KPVALFVAPSMHDASGATSNAIAVTLNEGAVTVTPDRAWLTSPSRAWPVSVDPDVLTLQGAAQDTYLESGSPDTYFGGDPLLHVGYDGLQAIRGMLNFNVDMYVPAGTTVDDAQLSLYLEAEKNATPTPVSINDVVVAWGA